MKKYQCQWTEDNKMTFILKTKEEQKGSELSFQLSDSLVGEAVFQSGGFGLEGPQPPSWQQTVEGV